MRLSPISIRSNFFLRCPLFFHSCFLDESELTTESRQLTLPGSEGPDDPLHMYGLPSHPSSIILPAKCEMEKAAM